MRSQPHGTNPAAVLTPFEVAAIRVLYARVPCRGRKWTQAKLAKAFGCSQEEISNVVTWTKWRWRAKRAG